MRVTEKQKCGKGGICNFLKNEVQIFFKKVCFGARGGIKSYRKWEKLIRGKYIPRIPQFYNLLTRQNTFMYHREEREGDVRK